MLGAYHMCDRNLSFVVYSIGQFKVDTKLPILDQSSYWLIGRSGWSVGPGRPGVQASGPEGSGDLGPLRLPA